MGRGWRGTRVRPEEQLRWEGPRVVLGAGAQPPAFAPSTWEAAVGSLVFMYLIAHSRPQLHLQAEQPSGVSLSPAPETPVALTSRCTPASWSEGEDEL
ncbi:unnamed protein product [Rangifer tarandus platyrhynchus]|uniref:Uncharacterized protein n=3 Tax=Rangifer tarandus platyrhynchus TaxID=3082113 RepID=A0AC59ZYI8_RANTA|nr:unnamed protein product [Rangifer tarandus platyrhynchus]CAI9709292.1 unnamed protein product [Rangifer tarandus platyrhynchus]